MLRPARRRPKIRAQLCAAAFALSLILISLAVLHSRLSSSSPFSLLRPPSAATTILSDHPLFDDASNDAFDDDANNDPIDELDDLNDDDRRSPEEDDDDTEDSPATIDGGIFWDHVTGTARRSLGKTEKLPLAETINDGKLVFGSDDEPVDDAVRNKLDSVRQIEDVLLIKRRDSGESAIREGWAKWLEGKADFLRRDKMLRSNLELLNPKNHPILQDPDGPGLSVLTRGDRLLQKAILKELDKTPFPAMEKVEKDIRVVNRRRKLGSDGNKRGKKVLKEEDYLYADGRRWGYYPGLDQRLTFSEFMEKFLDGNRCKMRVFLIWNSPPWMYTVRHQRGLESLLYHHRDACVVIFSETMELNFFRDFLEDGFKIAVAMPNLDELLEDTQTLVFARVWFKWRQTKYYPVHYSELIRLAALYKYGGIYLDSDVIVLKPLQLLNNSIGIEDQTSGAPIYNGAVLSFQKNSPFIKECLDEFYKTYDDKLLRWNGAELMTRVIKRIRSKRDKDNGLPNLNIEPADTFFPISSNSVARYFSKTNDDNERAREDALLMRIRSKSITFHFWNSLTSTLVPEPESIVGRLIDLYCLRCHEAL